MKLKISIDQQSKTGFLSGTQHRYKVITKFQLNEKEKKIFNDHPLFQDMIFISRRYGPKEYEVNNFLAKDIYEGKVLEIATKSVNEVFELREEMMKAAETFVGYIQALTGLVTEAELSYGEG